MTQTVLSDEQREEKIRSYAEKITRLCVAGRFDLAHKARESMELLIKGRSAHQIKKMEIEKGLV